MKCPCCGYSDDAPFNPSKKILELKRQRSRYTKKLIRKVINLIKTSIESDNTLIKEYYFWQTISKVPDEIVDWSIQRYLENKKSVYSGKGFKYLSQIVLNHSKNRGTIGKNELLRHGKPPSVIKIKED